LISKTRLQSERMVDSVQRILKVTRVLVLMKAAAIVWNSRKSYFLPVSFSYLFVFVHFYNLSHLLIQGGSNMTGTICVQTSHSLSRSYLNHLVSVAAGVPSRICYLVCVSKSRVVCHICLILNFRPWVRPSVRPSYLTAVFQSVRPLVHLLYFVPFARSRSLGADARRRLQCLQANAWLVPAIGPRFRLLLDAT
jgi:hypothetical protein